MLHTLTLIAGLGLVPRPPTPAPGPVSFEASDGVTVYANSFAGATPQAPVIILFHQADSSKNEYETIAPRLMRLGYNVLAIDQRSGGDLYPPANETVQHLGKSTENYLDVLPDMDAAFAWVKKNYPGAPIYAWGSSYSAALVFAFAARHTHDVAAVLAFSPGEYLPDKHFVEKAAHRVRVPAFIDSASTASEEEIARTIYDALRSRLKVDYVPKNGIHGSSTLREDRDPDGAAENWEAVTAFLARLQPPAPPH